MKTEQVWVIVGNVGLYVGLWFRRRDAIASHVHDIEWANYASRTQLRSSALGGLDTDQKAAWKRCRQRGDRAVKATVSWPQGNWGELK